MGKTNLDAVRRRAVDFARGPASVAASPDTDTALDIIRDFLAASGPPAVVITAQGTLEADAIESGYLGYTFSIRGESLETIIGHALGTKRSERGGYDFSDGVLGVCSLTLEIAPIKESAPAP